jgi:hypothetical protein
VCEREVLERALDEDLAAGSKKASRPSHQSEITEHRSAALEQAARSATTARRMSARDVDRKRAGRAHRTAGGRAAAGARSVDVRGQRRRPGTAAPRRRSAAPARAGRLEQQALERGLPVAL